MSGTLFRRLYGQLNPRRTKNWKFINPDMRMEVTRNQPQYGLAMLNLACGTRTRDGWTNVDFSFISFRRKYLSPLIYIIANIGILPRESYETFKAIDPNIVHADLRKGIPFDDNTFDVVYCSHFLEHLDKELALPFLKECLRVLARNGVIRIVVPNLERIVRDYLSALEALESGNSAYEDKYDWAMIELFDQMVRKTAGGEMQKYLELRLPNRQEVKSVGGKIINILRKILVRKRSPSKTGELHRWMYDRFSLKRLLTKAGFSDVQVCAPDKSRIPNWSGFALDINPDESVYKPGSLYMEATKKV